MADESDIRVTRFLALVNIPLSAIFTFWLNV